jgi:hypothetical protein
VRLIGDGFMKKQKKQYIRKLSMISVMLMGMMYLLGNLELSAPGGLMLKASVQAAEKPVRFVVFSDSQGNDNGVSSEILHKTMENIKALKQQPSFFVIPGDLVNGASSYEAIKGQLQYLKDILTEYYPEKFFYRGIGNHEFVAGSDGIKASSEIFQESGARYMEGTNKAIYYFDKNGSRFWMLDTEHKNLVGNVSDKVISWIQKNNNKATKHNFFFVHEPQYPNGMTAMLVNKLQRDKLWQQIDSMNSPMVFNGHEHYYTRRHINSVFNETVSGKVFRFKKNVYQVTVGGMNNKFYDDFSSTLNVDVKPKKVNHYAVVDVYKAKVTVRVYGLDGKVIDSFGSSN